MARNFELNYLDEKTTDGFPLTVANSVKFGDYKFVIWDGGIEPLYWWKKRPEEKKRKLVYSEVDKAIRFLKNIHVMLPRNKVYGSYGLKHIVEDVVGSYISNGALIYAAILCDEYKVTKSPNDQINAYISLHRGLAHARYGASKEEDIGFLKKESSFFCETRK